MSGSRTVGLWGLALAALCAGAALAQVDPPHFKPGLWNTTMAMGGVNATLRMCVDNSIQARAAAFHPPTSMGGGRCVQTSKTQIPGGYKVESNCANPRGVSQITTQITGDFQSQYRIDMTVQRESGRQHTATMVSQWSGPCPADMKPGQMAINMDMNKAIAAAAAEDGAPAPPTAPTGSAPKLDKVVLREAIQRYKVYYPTFYFHDADGDVDALHREIVATDAPHPRFNPISLIAVDPERQKSGGVYVGQWTCGPNPSSTTLRVYLTDRGGNRSNTLDYQVVCKGADDLPK